MTALSKPKPLYVEHISDGFFESQGLQLRLTVFLDAEASVLSVESGSRLAEVAPHVHQLNSHRSSPNSSCAELARELSEFLTSNAVEQLLITFLPC
jgi:hypothetical protein